MSPYLVNTTGPVPLVLDLHIAHERWGSNVDPDLNGHLHYPNDIDGPLNETVTDKIRQYHTDYNNRPSNTISFIPAISSTSGRLHWEFVHLLFYRLIGKLTAFLELQEFSLRNPTPWQVPLPSRGVLLTDQVESGTHPCQGCSPTY
jgi:hypothetical protein